MKKIELTVEALAVESFQVDGGAEQAHGTVLANELLPNTRARTCARTSCCPETDLC